MKSADKNTSVFPQGDLSHAASRRCGAGGPRSVAAAIDRKGWKRVRLGDVCKITKGEQLNRDSLADTGSIPVYNGGSSPSGYADNSNTDAENVIISEGGNSCGYVNFIHVPFWRGGHCYLLETDADKVLLYYVLKAKESKIMSLRVGTGLPNIQRERLNAFEFDLPTDTSEQRQIVSAFTSIDTHITALESLIAKYEAIKKATVNLLLKPKEDWKQVKLGVVFDLKVGGDLDLSHYSPYKTNDCRYEIVSNSLANHGHYGYTSLPKFPSDSITVTGRGNVGHAEYRQEPFGAIVRIVILSPKCNHVCAKFVAELINGSESFQIESTGVPQLTAPQIASTAIALPSIDEQKRIIAILDSIDGTISGLKSKLAKTQDIKQGMMSHFFG